MQRLRLGTFTPSVLLEVARRTGRLADHGLEVTEEAVPSSPSQFTSLAEGRFDAVVTSPDNVIAYRFVRANPLERLLDVVVTAGLDSDAGLSLGLRPGLTLPEASAPAAPSQPLSVGVDVPTSGFAFAAYGLLARAGLDRDDYTTVTLGSTPRRVSALAAGECDVTIMGAGNELVARAAGCTLHSRVTALGPYVGEVVARLADTPSAAAADTLADVLVETADAVRAGELAEETVAVARERLGLAEDLARAHHARLRDGGLLAGGRVPVEAVETLVGLRRTYRPSPDLDRVMGSLDGLLVHRARG